MVAVVLQPRRAASHLRSGWTEDKQPQLPTHVSKYRYRQLDILRIRTTKVQSDLSSLSYFVIAVLGGGGVGSHPL